MNVLIVTSSYAQNPDDSAAAAGLFVRDFAAETAKQGHRVRVLTQDRAAERQDPPSVDVVFFPWGGNRPLSSLRLTSPRDLVSVLSMIRNGAAALERMVKEERPDRLIAMWALPAGLLARYVQHRRRVPYRVWALGSDIWGYGLNLFTGWIVSRVLRGAEQVYADGRKLADTAQRISGVPCRFLPSSRRLPTGMPRPAELDPVKKNFLFIGRFHPNKGADILLDAVGLLDPGHRNNSRFFLFGRGPLEDSLREQIRRQDLGDCVSLMGYADRERAAAFLEHCHFLLVPSRIESIPVILSDAARSHCPAIVTVAGDMGEVVRQYRNGIVVSPDAHAIAAGILQSWDEDRSQYREGCDRMAAEFSLESSVRKMLE